MKRYILSLLIFVAIDALWLSLVAPKLYQKEIGHLMADKVNFGAAAVFYLIYIAAILIFVSRVPMLEKRYDGRPGWEAYKSKTGVFVPMLPKK